MTVERNIILTGFMGTGKTSVGRRLAQRLNYSFVDTDALIEARSGMTVAEIFRHRGEAAFRRLEADLAQELADGQRQVIATGGRFMLEDANAAALGRNGLVFCLWAESEEIMARVAEDGAAARPLLESSDPQARLETLLAERRSGYLRFTAVDTSGKTVDEVVGTLLDRLEHPGGVQGPPVR